MPDLVQPAMEALAPLIDRPFALFGHSVSALTVFELAREARRRGLRPPEHVFVSGHPAPQLPRRRPLISHLPRQEFTQALREHFEVDAILLDDPRLMEYMFPCLRGDYELVETYAYHDEPPLTVPLSVFGGSRDPETTEDELLAWGRHTTATFTRVLFEGNHMFIRASSDELAREVGRQLPAL